MHGTIPLLTQLIDNGNYPVVINNTPREIK